MKLDFIALEALCVSKANMRCGTKPPDIADILPSVRARGILVPLLVRPNGSAVTLEIVAGRRRYYSAVALKDEGADLGPLPCAILEDGDDATALEASLIENVARLDPDEVTRWETFTRLVKEGKTVDDIAATFGLAEAQVKRILALGNLLPQVRDLYRKEQIDAATVRHLTLASRKQQKEWLALFDSKDSYAPTGQQLKAWLFGGASIAIDKALFDLANYSGSIVADLFGEGGYFGEAEAFWTAQNAAIEARKAEYLEAGWADVIVIPAEQYFSSWEYEKTAKKKGGKVYLDVRSNGEVAFYEGYLSRREAKLKAAGESEAPAKPKRPELTGPLNVYIDLHRHAAVRSAVAAHAGVALRLMVAHAIAGSALWNIRAEPQAAHSDKIVESVETSASEAVFDVRRGAGPARFFARRAPRRGRCRVRAGRRPAVGNLFEALLADRRASAGGRGGGDGRNSCCRERDRRDGRTSPWRRHGRDLAADDCLFELLRDREVLLKLVAEVAGEQVAKDNAKEKAKVLKGIVSDCLGGMNGRTKIERFVPRWMRFAPSAYTERGGVGSVQRYNRVAALFETDEQPLEPATADEVDCEAADAELAVADSEALVAEAA